MWISCRRVDKSGDCGNVNKNTRRRWTDWITIVSNLRSEYSQCVQSPIGFIEVDERLNIQAFTINKSMFNSEDNPLYTSPYKIRSCVIIIISFNIQLMVVQRLATLFLKFNSRTSSVYNRPPLWFLGVRKWSTHPPIHPSSAVLKFSFRFWITCIQRITDKLSLREIRL